MSEKSVILFIRPDRPCTRDLFRNFTFYSLEFSFRRK